MVIEKKTIFNFSDDKKFSKIRIYIIQKKVATYKQIMNKLMLWLVVFVFVHSSHSAVADSGYGFKGAAQIFREDENFIVNGDFSLPGLWFCTWQIKDHLEGWSTPDEIERGLGTLYNLNWGNIVVVELDGTHNDVIKQRIPLQPGHYILSFRWAGRTAFLWTSGMSIYWNDSKIFEVLQAPDDKIHEQHIPIFVRSQKNCVLELRGEARSDMYGMTVANFALKKDRSKKYNDLPLKDGQTFDRVNQDLQLGENPPL